MQAQSWLDQEERDSRRTPFKRLTISHHSPYIDILYDDVKPWEWAKAWSGVT